MARLVIKIGAAPNDKMGDSARTGAQKINSNFMELYSYISGNGNESTLPVAIPVSRGGTGATTTQGARDGLGLGSAATKDVGLNTEDVMAVGSFGLGLVNSPAVPTTPIRKPSTYKSGELAYVVFDNVSSITLASQTDTIKGQVGIRNLGADSADLVVRQGVGEIFSPWYTAHTGLNSIVTVNGNIKACRNSGKLTNANCISQHQQAYNFTRSAKGVYKIVGAVLDRNMWVKEVPLDENGVKLYDAALAQAGTTLTVTVTKAGAAYDIPAGSWVDLHLV